MHFGESFIAAYYERVRGYATITNVRFPGPKGRNWSDLDVIALPMPLRSGAEPRPAEVVQVKWRARFRLVAGDETWLDESVVNAADAHAVIRERLGDWPYRMVLVTTGLWLNELGDRAALAQRLDQTARALSPTCQGVDVKTFEEIAADWRLRLGEAVQGWAEDPFTFHLQVLQKGQTPPPGHLPLPSDPIVTAAEAASLVNYDPTSAFCVDASTKWLEGLVGPGRTYVVKSLAPYDSGAWRGMAARVHGGTWVFLGKTDEEPCALSVWYQDREEVRIAVTKVADLSTAARKFYVWWNWNEAGGDAG